jgi:hypothetical protein
MPTTQFRGVTLRRRNLYVFTGGLCFIFWAGAAKAEIADKEFDDAIAEGGIHKQVVRFQKALDALPDGKDPETLARQVEAQLNIKEIVLKGREAQSAKLVPFFPIGSSIIGGLIGGLVPALISWRLSKVKTKEKPRDNP